MKPYHLSCRYRHKWVTLLPDTLSFTDKSERFCKACLEEGRIEVASIQLHTTGMFGNQIEAHCLQCKERTFIPLMTDLAMGGMILALESLEDMWEVKDRWYHLPERWPHCRHCGAELGTMGI